MLKRILSIFLILSSFILLPSCTESERSVKPYVIGTVFPQYDIAREIGGDDVTCEMLLPPGTDSHGYTGDNPSDVYRIMKCDVFIYVGGETDSVWVEKLKEKIEHESDRAPIFISLCDVCDTLDEDDEGMIEGEGEDETLEPGSDEHVWTSLKNAVKIAEAVRNALCEIDSENAGKYTSRCESYVKKLESLDRDFQSLFSGVKNKTLVFADRFPFRYFAHEYGIKCFAAFNGCSSQAEPAPTTVVKLCKIVEENKMPYIFYIETSQSNVPELISKSCGCKTMLLHSCHTVTEDELKEGASYISLMRKNLENLRKALKDE